MSSRKVDEKMFATVKQCVKHGMTQAQIEKVFGISHSIISYIAHADSLEDYSNKIAVKNQKYKGTKPAAPVQEITPEETKSEDCLLQKIIEQNERMISLMERLCDAWSVSK